MSLRLPYMHVARSERARQNEFYVIRECLYAWSPPDPVTYMVERIERSNCPNIRTVRPEECVPEMQTFLPYPDFTMSARCLDRARLGKQRVEAYQVLRALHGDYVLTRAWENHPATRMWRGHYSWLQRYYNEIIKEWIIRGYATELGTVVPYDTIQPLDETSVFVNSLDRGGYPPWLGYPPLHASHRSSLLAKDPAWYSQFGWEDEPKIGYVWPV